MPLSALQRAYWLGYRRAKQQARRDLEDMADELASLQDDVAASADDQAIEEASSGERDPDAVSLISFFASR